MTKIIISQQLTLFCFFPLIFIFDLTDSNKTRQRKRRRLNEVKKKLRERIMHYNADAAFEEKIDIEGACSLSEDVTLPWEVQGDGKHVLCDLEINKM